MRAHVTPASSSSTSFSTVWHAGPTVMATAGQGTAEGRQAESLSIAGGRWGGGGRASERASGGKP